MKNPYDELYKQIDMLNKPFGYSVDYILWRNSKIKKRLARYITKNGKILDIGGGTGIMAQFLPDFIDLKSNYYNMDVSNEMLKYSSYNNIIGTAEDIPFPDNSFNYVILSEVLEHVNDKIKVLNECYRVLKFEGLLLLSTPRAGWINDFRRSPLSIFLLIDSIINKILPTRSGLQIPSDIKDEPSDERWLIETLKSINFSIVEQYRCDNHLPWGKSGESKFWRWFADRFVSETRYGHCTLVVCKK